MRRILTLLVMVVAFGGSARADEILYFKNGTTMPVRGHRLDGATMHVDLESGATIAFPVEQIERIERAGKDVFVDASGKSRANRAFEGNHVVTGDYSVQGRAPVRHTRGDFQGTEADATTPPLDTDEGGLAVYKPFRGQGGARGKIGHTGSREVLSSPMATSKGQGIMGTSRIGSRNTIGNSAPPGSPKKQRPIGLAPRDEPPPPPATEDPGTEPPADSDEE